MTETETQIWLTSIRSFNGKQETAVQTGWAARHRNDLRVRVRLEISRIRSNVMNRVRIRVEVRVRVRFRDRSGLGPLRWRTGLLFSV